MTGAVIWCGTVNNGGIDEPVVGRTDQERIAVGLQLPPLEVIWRQCPFWV